MLRRAGKVPAAAALERSFDRLQRQGVVAPDIQRARVDSFKVSADPVDRTIKIPTKDRADLTDYLKARMGEGDLATSTILHENDHLRAPGFWDDRAQMRAWRARNVMAESPMMASLQDDAVRATRRLSPSDSDLMGEVNQLEAEPFFRKNIVGHDYQPDEILADSAARFEGHQRKMQRTGQLPIGDRGWMQELAVASTAGDRVGSTVEAMRAFAEQQRRRYPNISEGRVPTQGERPFTRLYRGESTQKAKLPDWVEQSPARQGAADAEGRWWTDKEDIAKWYADEAAPNGRVTTLDIGPVEAEGFRVTNNPDAKRFSRDPENEFFLPRKVIQRVRGEF